MTKPKNDKIETILMAIDFTEKPEQLLERTQMFATIHNPEVILLHVIPELYRASVYAEAYALREELRDNAIAGAKDKMVAYTEMLNAAFSSVKSVIEVGDPAEKIVEVSHRIDADLIVMGEHCHTGFSHFFHHNVAEKILRSAKTSIYSFYVEPE